MKSLYLHHLLPFRPGELWEKAEDCRSDRHPEDKQQQDRDRGGKRQSLGFLRYQDRQHRYDADDHRERKVVCETPRHLVGIHQADPGPKQNAPMRTGQDDWEQAQNERGEYDIPDRRPSPVPSDAGEGRGQRLLQPTHWTILVGNVFMVTARCHKRFGYNPTYSTIPQQFADTAIPTRIACLPDWAPRAARPGLIWRGRSPRVPRCFG